MTSADDLLSTLEAAAYLGVTDQTVRRWAKEQKLRHVRMPSGRVKFHREDLDAIFTPVEPKGAA